ncbi:MAG: cysteine hydrolase family protein [Pseudomonadota bacterium]
MIKQFLNDTALLLIDIQAGVDDLAYYGGPTGRRNNPDAETKMAALLAAWRERELPVVFTRHDSREPDSPLKWSLPSGDYKSGFEPIDGEAEIWKDVNSGFIGTTLELELRRRGATRLVVVGFFTNFCVETTTRMAGNMGYDTYLVHDACATTNRVDLDGHDHEPELVHALSIASLNGEFCTALTHSDALQLLDGDNSTLNRVQGNE